MCDTESSGGAEATLGHDQPIRVIVTSLRGDTCGEAPLAGACPRFAIAVKTRRPGTLWARSSSGSRACFSTIDFIDPLSGTPTLELRDNHCCQAVYVSYPFGKTALTRRITRRSGLPGRCGL